MNKNYHFIGIGGIGMSGIALLFLRNGFKVSGSDLKENQVTRELQKLGAKIFIGHSEKNINGQDAVIYSSAIKEDNCELRLAKVSGIRLLKRAEALAELMQEKKVITVAGSHGKTTTTSLVSYMLIEAGLSPTVAIGGILSNINTNACFGDGDFFVAEADESDGSFLNYKPSYSIITNIDREHLDYYNTYENQLKTFASFLEGTQEGGLVFACSDDPNLLKIAGNHKGRCLLFGLGGKADIYARNLSFNGLSSDFDCYLKEKFISRFHLSLGGKHNISNSLAVIALGLELGIDLGCIARILRDYKGALRRLETKFKNAKFTVIDDYAHHPSEIKATLSALSTIVSKRKIAIFQPHRYSRTLNLMDDFAGSFTQTDYLIVTDIYAAGEQPIEGIRSEKLVEKIRNNSKNKEVIYLPKEKILSYVLNTLREGDLVITLGAGDIVKVSDALAQALR